MKKLLFLLPFLLFSQIHACDCEVTEKLDSAIANANVVFRGVCLDKNTNWMSSGMKYTFQVQESWVRTIEPFVTINSPQVGVCGYPFQVGEEYLVYVNKQFSLRTTLCDPTKPYSTASQDLELLGESYEISASPGSRKMQITLGVVVGLALLFVLFVVLSGKIFKRKSSS